MTKHQAIQHMLKGHKVRHIFFDQDEWITMQGPDTIITSDGYPCPENIFWQYRSARHWLTGWSLYVKEISLATSN